MCGCPVMRMLSYATSRENSATAGAFRALRCQEIFSDRHPWHTYSILGTLASSLIPPRVPVLFCELRLLSTKHTKFAKGLLRYGSREKILVVVTLTLLKHNVKRFDHGGNERLRGGVQTVPLSPPLFQFAHDVAAGNAGMVEYLRLSGMALYWQKPHRSFFQRPLACSGLWQADPKYKKKPSSKSLS